MTSDVSRLVRKATSPGPPKSTCELAGCVVVQLIVALERVMLLLAMSRIWGGTALGVAVGEGEAVRVGVSVAVGTGVRVDVAVLVGVAVRTGVGVLVEKTTIVGGCGTCVLVAVAALVGASVVVAVLVTVAVAPIVAVAEAVAVAEGVTVTVLVGVRVGVGVAVTDCASLTCNGSV